MAGVFSKTVRPKLAGAYFNWEAEGTPTVSPNIATVIATIGTHDWGPANVATFVADDEEFKAVFGESDTQLRRAAFQLFKGEARAGRGGAGGAWIYRAAVAGGTPATRILQNTTPAAALTLTARYPGTRGNALRVTVQASVNAGEKDLLILDGTRVIERHTFPQTNIAALRDTINSTSNWVSAAMTVDGVTLADVASVALAGGADGAVLTGTEWSAGMAALESKRFSIFVPALLTDSTIRGSIVTWQAALNSRGKRFETVVGTAAADTLSGSVVISKAINDPNVVVLGGFTVKANDLPGDPVLSAAEFAPRVAGSIAFRGESKDLMYARFVDVELVTGATLAGEESALDGGLTTMTSDTNPVAPAFIREGVTSYWDDSASPVDQQGNKTKPKRLYKRIKNMRIQHGVELEVDDWAQSGDVLGDLANNERGRAIFVGRVVEALETRVGAEVVQPGYTVQIDPSPPADDDDDAVFLRWGFHPTRSVRQMFNTIRLG